MNSPSWTIDLPPADHDEIVLTGGDAGAAIRELQLLGRRAILVIRDVPHFVLVLDDRADVPGDELTAFARDGSLVIARGTGPRESKHKPSPVREIYRLDDAHYAFDEKHRTINDCFKIVMSPASNQM